MRSGGGDKGGWGAPTRSIQGVAGAVGGADEVRGGSHRGGWGRQRGQGGGSKPSAQCGRTVKNFAKTCSCGPTGLV